MDTTYRLHDFHIIKGNTYHSYDIVSLTAFVRLVSVCGEL